MSYLSRQLPFIIPALIAFLVLCLPLLTFAADPPGPSWAQQLMWGLVVGITGFILGLAGILLDASINLFVIGFGSLYLNSGIGVAVDSVWVVIRDFMNLLFIFGFVYIGFKMILGSDTSNTRRWLVHIILAALLVNFSLFITKFVVDISNQLSTNIVLAAFESNKTSGTFRDGQPEVSMSSAFMDLMGITNIFDRRVYDSGKTRELTGNKDNAWGYIFGTGIFFLITAFVFAAGAIMLTIRFAVLCVYLVFSPIMFIGWILPPVSDQMGKYWKGFLKRAFFAPIFFLFIYFSLLVLTKLTESLEGLSGGEWGNALQANANQVESAQSTLPFFVLTCIFMIMSLVAAERLGGDGAKQALSLGRSITNKTRRFATRSAGAATAGVAASAGRNTVGRAANWAVNNNKLRNYAAKSFIGKAAFKTAQYGASASYDPRQIAGVGKTLGIGEGKKGGYVKNLEDKVKADKKFLKDLGEVDVTTAEGKRKVAAQQETLRKRKEKEKVDTENAIAITKNIQNESLKDLQELDDAIKMWSEAADDLAERTNAKKFALATDKSLTINQKIKLEKEIEQDQAGIEEQKTQLAQLQQARNIAANRKKLKDQIKKEEQNELDARAKDDLDGLRLAQANKAKRQSELAGIDTAITHSIDDLKSEVKKIDALLKNNAQLKAAAEGEVKYSRAISYMKQLEGAEKFWGKLGTGGSATSAGAMGIATAGLATGGVYAVAAGLGASAKAAQNRHSREELEKEYGKDGGKKVKKESERKKARDQIAALKDIERENGDDSSEKNASSDKK